MRKSILIIKIRYFKIDE